MARVYFYDYLIEAAKQSIELKSTDDKIKAFNDVTQIKNYFDQYQKSGQFDVEAASKLDERLCKEYDCINLINNYGISTVSNNVSSLPVNRYYSPYDDVINRLNLDLYGIYCEVLIKEGLVKEVKDFIDRVE